MIKEMKPGDLVRISEKIPKFWRDGHQWGSIAIVAQVEGMMITLVCNTGFIRELPVQLSPQYLSSIDETG
jgi:hypothetical protein